MARRLPRTDVLLIVGAGIVSAFQVGKAPLALPVIQADLALSLVTVSWLISAFAVVGAVIGALTGLAADRFGAKRLLVGGLLLQGAGSASGALAAGAPVLLLTRVIEGIGFLAVIVAAPALILALVAGRARDRAIALWATYMPAGMTIVLLSGALLAALQWRGFWMLNALILIGYGALAARALHVPRFAVAARPASPGRDSRPGPNLRRAFASPGPWLLGGIFAAFSTLFFAVFGFLPTLLPGRLGIGAGTAGTLAALAVAVSGVGNLVSGQLLARGIRPLPLLTASFLLMMGSGAGFFSEYFGGAVSYVLCLVFALVCGATPVVVMGAVTRYAPGPELVGLTMGFAMQGNNIGMIIGPAVTGAIAATAGWPAVTLLFVAVTALAGLLIAALARVGPRR